MLRPHDDLRHELREEPHARESLFYGVPLPDEGLIVFAYTWVGAHDDAGFLFAIVGGDDNRRAFSAGDGEDIGDCDFDDWRVGGLAIRHRDPLKVADVGFEGDGVSFSARFEGLHPAFPYSANADGCPPFAADDRFEQSCRVTGTLVLDGREIPIDATGQRDHSWGVRDWDVIQDWKWVSGQAAGGEVTFNAMLMHARGETTVNGYVSRDGAVTALIGARVQGRYDARWWQTGADVVLRDAGGGELTASLERYALLRLEAGERIVMHEAACSGTIDGAPASFHWECGWDRSYVALQEARAAAAEV